MGIRRLAGIVAVLAWVVVGAPSAPAAEEVEFPPNTWVQYCGRGYVRFIDVNSSGEAIAQVGLQGYLYDLHAGTRTKLHDGVTPQAINDAGVVVGNVGGSGSAVGFVEDTVSGDFTLVEIEDSTAALLAINENGMALGVYYGNGPDDSGYGMFTYDAGSGETTDLGMLGADNAYGADISDDGTIVGTKSDVGGGAVGFSYHVGDDSPRTIAGFDGAPTRPAAISGSLVVGASADRSFLTNLDAGSIEDMGISAAAYSAASDVNDDGIVVGAQTYPSPPERNLQVAYAYDSVTGELSELGSANGVLSFAEAVSDEGFVVGGSLVGADGCASVLQLRLAPHAPTSPSVDLFGDDISLSWTGPDFDGYDADLTYVVRFDGIEVARVGAPLTSVVLEATPCTGGTYTVTAENAEGESAPSEGAVLVARSCTPTAPAVPVPAVPTFTG